ncbi:hypothetical protein DL766_003996 [Monosporascus sp. MC13-8B]|uniref:NYN domain-containing protein n=1 Tax=Monosporascus cannonballus TaxID=155416 RepID=A0ABY0GXB7_9PEZI|nr:hypothetical protein DL762_008272 [Monosporascus cannonballus]RYO95916.1 hypothetical protein DL763_003464 [Monosporascus cannonballus]RYP32321.1 hypothetical protein DL766_003996 [Monosporascus sp. MC13-8B]
MKGSPQRPGPNGSRVVRKRLSTPRLGAGLSAIAMQIGSFSRLRETPVANEPASDGILPRSGSVDSEILALKMRPSDAKVIDVRNDAKPFIGEPMVRTAVPITDNETMDDSILCDSPVGSTDWDGFDASCNSFDGNHLSSPNSTPPPSNGEEHRKDDPYLATTKMNNCPRQRIADYLSSHQPLSDLTDQLQSTTPLYAEDVSNNGCSPTVRSIAAAPCNGAITTGGTGVRPVLGPTIAQLERLFEATQRFRDTNRLKESDDQSPDRFGVAVRHSPIHQPSQCSSVFASDSRLCDIVSTSRPSEDNYYLKTPMSFQHLARILERGRNIQKRVLAGSLAFPASRRENWPPHLREAESMGYEMNIFDRVMVEKIAPRFKRQSRTSSCRATLHNANDVASADESTEDGVVAKVTRKRGEQGVDENLHLNMMNSIIDNTSPGIMVLATGDAAQAQFSGGFKYYASRALERGWMLEVVSWNRTMSSAWYDPDFIAKYGDRIRIIELDEFIEELHAGYLA